MRSHLPVAIIAVAVIVNGTTGNQTAPASTPTLPGSPTSRVMASRLEERVAPGELPRLIALGRALKKRGIRLLHLKTDVEQISNQTTIAKLREKKA